MDFTLFRLRVVADWLELEVGTLNPHPAHRIQKASMGAFSYVTGLDPETRQDIRDTGKQGKNTPTTAFACRIQSPERFSVVVSALNTISDLDPNATITVRGIEIALDAYRRTAYTTDEQLAEMTAFMLRHINRPEGANDDPRFYSWRGTPELRYGKKQVERGVLDGKTAMYGNHDDDFVVRGYLKNYDTVRNSNDKAKGKTLLTNPLDHRARIEVRLQGLACPIQTLDDLKIFTFETLAKFFKFRMPTSGQSGIEAVISDRLGSLGGVIGQTGQLKATQGMKGRKTKNRRRTEAAPLNEIARTTLRSLTIRWGNATGRGKVARGENYTNSVCSTLSQHPEIITPSCLPLHAGNPCHYSEFARSENLLNTMEEAPPARVVLSTSQSGTCTHQTACPIQSQCPGTTTFADKEDLPKHKVYPIETVSQR